MNRWEPNRPHNIPFNSLTLTPSPVTSLSWNGRGSEVCRRVLSGRSMLQAHDRPTTLVRRLDGLVLDI